MCIARTLSPTASTWQKIPGEAASGRQEASARQDCGWTRMRRRLRSMSGSSLHGVGVGGRGSWALGEHHHGNIPRNSGTSHCRGMPSRGTCSHEPSRILASSPQLPLPSPSDAASMQSPKIKSNRLAPDTTDDPPAVSAW